MDIKKNLFLIAGTALIFIGYHKMGVAPDTSFEDVLTIVAKGQIAVFLGSAFVVFAILRKS